VRDAATVPSLKLGAVVVPTVSHVLPERRWTVYCVAPAIAGQVTETWLDDVAVAWSPDVIGSGTVMVTSPPPVPQASVTVK
jgi:hypothetical protein